MSPSILKFKVGDLVEYRILPSQKQEDGYGIIWETKIIDEYFCLYLIFSVTQQKILALFEKCLIKIG